MNTKNRFILEFSDNLVVALSTKGVFLQRKGEAKSVTLNPAALSNILSHRGFSDDRVVSLAKVEQAAKKEKAPVAKKKVKAAKAPKPKAEKKVAKRVRVKVPVLSPVTVSKLASEGLVSLHSVLQGMGKFMNGRAAIGEGVFKTRVKAMAAAGKIPAGVHFDVTTHYRVRCITKVAAELMLADYQAYRKEHNEKLAKQAESFRATKGSKGADASRPAEGSEQGALAG